MAETFQKSDGDIREVLKTMLKSPEFWSPDLYRVKEKNAAGVCSLRDSRQWCRSARRNAAGPNIESHGHAALPTTAAHRISDESRCVNSSALLNRMNFSLQLGTGRLRGVDFSAQNLLGLGAAPETNADQVLAALENSLIQGDISPQTHDTIVKQMNDPQVTGRCARRQTARAEHRRHCGIDYGVTRVSEAIVVSVSG